MKMIRYITTLTAMFLACGGASASCDAPILPNAQLSSKLIGFEDIGDMGGVSPTVIMISGDGSTLFGEVTMKSGTGFYRWSEKDGVQFLGDFGDRTARPTAISRDGSVVAGYLGEEFQPEPLRLFRWTASTGVKELGAVDTNVTALTMSDDGAIISGWRQVTHNRHDEQEDKPDLFRLFQWKAANGIVDLDLAPRYSTDPVAISADQKVVFGASHGSGPIPKKNLFRWSKETGVENLFQLGSLFDRGYAGLDLAVSADGSVAAGALYRQPKNNVYDTFSFRWTKEGGLQGLGIGPNALVHVSGVSANGKVIVGKRFIEPGKFGKYSVFRWTEDSGLQELEGVGGEHTYVLRVSSDGRTVFSENNDLDGLRHITRWTLAHGAESLGADPRFGILPQNVSQEGTTVAGWFYSSACERHIFRWKAGQD